MGKFFDELFAAWVWAGLILGSILGLFSLAALIWPAALAEPPVAAIWLLFSMGWVITLPVGLGARLMYGRSHS